MANTITKIKARPPAAFINWEGAVYSNKAQAMAFFDLVENGAQIPPSNEVAGG